MRITLLSRGPPKLSAMAAVKYAPPAMPPRKKYQTMSQCQSGDLSIAVVLRLAAWRLAAWRLAAWRLAAWRLAGWRLAAPLAERHEGAHAHQERRAHREERIHLHVALS